MSKIFIYIIISEYTFKIYISINLFIGMSIIYTHALPPSKGTIKPKDSAALIARFRAERDDAWTGIPTAHSEVLSQFCPVGLGPRVIELKAAVSRSKLLSQRANADSIAQL